MEKYRKIRGHNRRQKQIKTWVDYDSNIDLVKRLKKYNSCSSFVFVHPWCDISILNSEFPEPKKRTKKEILAGLEKIYNSWKLQLEKLDEPYYLKIWAYEPRISKSRVVCGIDDRIEYYENLFHPIENLGKKSHVVDTFSSDFKWSLVSDDLVYFENDLSSELELYDSKESYLNDKKLLRKLKNGNYRTQVIGNVDDGYDKEYLVPKGKIWVGER